MGLPVGVVVENKTEFFRFVELGDRLFLSSRLASITGPKTTRLGEGYFWVMEGITRNQRDECHPDRTTMFAYSPRGAPEQARRTRRRRPAARQRRTPSTPIGATHLPPDQRVPLGRRRRR